LKAAIEVFGPVMMQTYAQTEAPMFCTALMPEEHVVETGREKLLASCGRPMLLTQVAIMSEDGALLPPGEPGEIVLRGDLVMLGYYKDPEKTAEVSKFGWHHTGDIGVRDENGYFYVVDRKKDMIITGGFNVYPAEIEQAIWAHPAVQECAVVGVPDEKWGEAVKAVIELKPGSALAEEELIAFCKERLGSVKTPKSVDIWPSLPRTAVGKINKKEVRATFWAGHDRAI
jgi:acyl-CoA synthetase (AMP-forming)/AMP-acid ligase II